MIRVVPMRRVCFGVLSRAGLIAAAAAAALACRSGPPPSPPPSEVTVIAVAPRTVEQVYEFVGNVEASRSVNVRAQVGGVIMARPFTEGAAVSSGEVLFRLDTTAYAAEWRSAAARLAEAEARLSNAEQNLARYAALLRDNAVARRDYDNAETEARQARAAVDAGRAAVDRARKNLDDTVVRAELSGRVGRANLEVGARVRGPDDVLTTIDVLDPIYVTFRPSAQQLLSWRRDPRATRMLVAGGPVRIQAVLPDSSVVPGGRLGFIDPVLDPATGTQQFRAEFRNPRRLLLPGQFVRVRLLGLMRDGAILVPQRAVIEQMGRQVVFVVGAGDTVRAREIETGSWTGDDWLIERGLAAGDRVIVDGIQKVGPGLRVRPVALGDSTATSRAAATAPQPGSHR